MCRKIEEGIQTGAECSVLSEDLVRKKKQVFR